MNFYNSFNEMFSSNTKQDMSVFNTVSAIAEFENGNYRQAYWDFGSNTVWFDFYDAETDELFDEDFGAHVDNDCFLNDVDVGGELDDMADIISTEIDDLWTSSNAEYGTAKEYAYYNSDKVNDIVFKHLKELNLKAKGVPSMFDEVGRLGVFEDGTCFYELYPFTLEPIDKEKFEQDNYNELGERLAKFCSGVRDNPNGRSYGHYSLLGSWGIGEFRPC